MDAIKKKMLAMKMEKEIATDKAEQTDQKLRDTEEEKNKIDEDLTTLQKKFSNLENEFDNAKEQLAEANNKLEASEKRVNEDQNVGGTVLAATTRTGAAAERTGRAADDDNNNNNMGEKSPADPPESYSTTESIELSQESHCTTQDSDPGLTGGSQDSGAIPAEDGGGGVKVKKKKKKDGKKIKKKKSSKSKTKDGDTKGEGKEHKSKKSSSSRRPEPEGGNSTSNVVMDEYDKVIYSNEPLFSDMELSDKENGPELVATRYTPSRIRRQIGPGDTGMIYIPCTQFGLNSNTMIKFAIIGTELQNVLQVSLKRVGCDVY